MLIEVLEIFQDEAQTYAFSIYFQIQMVRNKIKIKKKEKKRSIIETDFSKCTKLAYCVYTKFVSQ
jgi:hypothetical protein